MVWFSLYILTVQITAPQSLQQVVKKQQVLESKLHRLQDVSLVKLQQNISQLFSQVTYSINK